MKKDKNVIVDSLDESDLVKVRHYKLAKENQDNHVCSYEGDDKVKKAKLESYRVKFGSLRMNEDATIFEYFIRVDEVENMIKQLN